METIEDIMKMDREKQSRPINTAEVFQKSIRMTRLTVPINSEPDLTA